MREKVRVRRLLRRLSRRTSDAAFLVDRAATIDRSASGPLADLFFAHDGRLIHKWVHYLETVAYVDGVRLLITGSGDDAEFRTLAAGTAASQILPR